jgi:type IV secretion system protein VirD4
MLLDEFPALGRMSFFETQLAYLRSYGVKVVMIAQSLNQYEQAYGSNSSLLDNAHVRVTLGANDDRTAKRISDLLGQATLTRKHQSLSKKRGALFFSQVTVSDQEYARPLRTAGEVMQLPSDEAILLIGGLQPYLGVKVRDYLDPRFRAQAAIAAPSSAEAQAAELPPAPPLSEWWSLPACSDAADSRVPDLAEQGLAGDFGLELDDCIYGGEEPLLDGESDACEPEDGVEAQS